MASVFDHVYSPSNKIPTTRALILTGLQNDFCSQDGKLYANVDEAFVKRLENIVTAFRGHGSIIWVRSEFDHALPAEQHGIDAVNTCVPYVSPAGSKTLYQDRDLQPVEHPQQGIEQQSADSIQPRDPNNALPQQGIESQPVDSIQPRALNNASPQQSIESQPVDSIQPRVHDNLLLQQDEELFLDVNAHGGPATVKGSAGAQYAEQVQHLIKPGDQHIVKHNYSAFEGTGLLHSLRINFVSHVFICGAITNISAYATALDAASNGIEVTLIEDCLAYRHRVRHDLAIQALKRDYVAMPRTSSQVLEALKKPHLLASINDEDEGEVDDQEYFDDAASEDELRPHRVDTGSNRQCAAAFKAFDEDDDPQTSKDTPSSTVGYSERDTDSKMLCAIPTHEHMRPEDLEADSNTDDDETPLQITLPMRAMYRQPRYTSESGVLQPRRRSTAGSSTRSRLTAKQSVHTSALTLSDSAHDSANTDAPQSRAKTENDKELPSPKQDQDSTSLDSHTNISTARQSSTSLQVFRSPTPSSAPSSSSVNHTPTADVQSPTTQSEITSSQSQRPVKQAQTDIGLPYATNASGAHSKGGSTDNQNDREVDGLRQDMVQASSQPHDSDSDRQLKTQQSWHSLFRSDDNNSSKLFSSEGLSVADIEGLIPGFRARMHKPAAASDQTDRHQKRPLFRPESPEASAGSSIVHDILDEKDATGIFDELKAEVQWARMLHQTGEVPRLVCCQGTFNQDSSMPVYRHPSDKTILISPWTKKIDDVRKVAERIVGHDLNHALIQLYRTGHDFISEHSDKTLDIVPGSNIVNVSFGAERTMRLRTKRGSEAADRVTHRIPMPHNSMLIMSLATNAEYLHGIKADKRREAELSEAESAYSGQRISITFRQIGTFLTADGDKIYGQGAVAKAVHEARPVINGDEAESKKLIDAFGQENQSSVLDWEKWYGHGSDVLHVR